MRIDLKASSAKLGAVMGLVVAACVVATLIAYWFWQLSFRPSPPLPIALEVQPATLAQVAKARHLFGAATGLPDAALAIPATINMALAGIVSSADARHGVAIILIDGKKAVTAMVGQEIAPDVVLSRVAPDHVEVTQRGQTINLRLATKK